MRYLVYRTLMIKIGCHLSSAGGFTAMAQTALKIGADTFQYFTRNPRGGAAKAIDKSDIENFLSIAAQNKIAPIIAHAPYTLNLCSAAENIREFSKNMFADDLLRTELIAHSYYNFHPGSHTGQGTDVGIDQIANVLNMALKPEQTTMVLLETMAGKGSEIGGTFEEIKKIISTMIIHGIKDPRVSRLASITAVEVTKDLSYAKVYVSVLGTEKEKQDTLEALESAAGFIRTEVASKIKVRHVPEFIFKADNSLDYSLHISQIIHDIEKDREKKR